MTDIQVGDKVQLTAVVEAVSDNGKIILVEGHGWLPSLGFEVIEKAKPPVVTFKPGQTVRHIKSGISYLITNEGPASIDTGYLYRHYESKWPTSEHFELVE